MGLGDIFKGAASAIPGASALGWAINEGRERLGNEMVEGFQRVDRRGEAPGARGQGALSPDPLPTPLRTAVDAAESPGGAPYRALGRYFEDQTQNKIEAAQGYYKLGNALLTNPTSVYRGARGFVSQVRENPGILKGIAADVAVATALDPTTYMGAGLTSGLGIAEATAARAGRRAVTEVAEETAARAVTRTAARSADEIAEEGLERAATASAERIGRQTTRSGRALQAIDQAPVNLRDTIGRDPIGRVGQARIGLGEAVLPGARGPVGALAKDVIQGSPLMPTEGGALAFRQAKWRAGQIGNRAGIPSTIHRLGIAEDVGRAINDPEQALNDPRARTWAGRGAEWAMREHPEVVAAAGGLVAANAGLGAYQAIKAVTGDEGEASGSEATAEAKQAVIPPASPHLDTLQEIGLSQFHADRGQAMRSRQPGRAKRLGTVQRNGTMPTRIGPSNWYGPQGGYQAGRGFRQRDDVLGV